MRQLVFQLAPWHWAQETPVVPPTPSSWTPWHDWHEAMPALAENAWKLGLARSIQAAS
jgi:hypothetical protein